MNLCKFLPKNDFKIFGYDPDKKKSLDAKLKYGVEIVSPHCIFEEKIDIFSPCATGNIITFDNYQSLKASYVIGGANCQLEDDILDRKLLEQGTIYIPDFISNAGGVIDIACEGKNYSEDYVYAKVNIISEKIKLFYDTSLSTNQTILQTAKDYVERQLI